MKKCASCRAGEVDELADYYVTGYWPESSFHEVGPYHGHLCDSHLRMYLMDGFNVKTKRKVNTED